MKSESDTVFAIHDLFRRLAYIFPYPAGYLTLILDLVKFSFISGKFIKMLMPANSEGFAFGEKKLKFGRKKKGYFPISHVIRAD